MLLSKSRLLISLFRDCTLLLSCILIFLVTFIWFLSKVYSKFKVKLDIKKTLLSQLLKNLQQLMNSLSECFLTQAGRSKIHCTKCFSSPSTKLHNNFGDIRERIRFYQEYTSTRFVLSLCEWISDGKREFDVNVLCISKVDIGTQRKVNQLFLLTFFMHQFRYLDSNKLTKVPPDAFNDLKNLKYLWVIFFLISISLNW